MCRFTRCNVTTRGDSRNVINENVRFRLQLVTDLLYCLRGSSVEIATKSYGKLRDVTSTDLGAPTKLS